MRYAAVTGAIVLAVVWLITTYHPLPPALIGGGLDCRITAKPLLRKHLASCLSGMHLWYAPQADGDTRIEAIRTAYKTRFGQDGVLRADGAPACVSF
jgi:hypothetical protein